MKVRKKDVEGQKHEKLRRQFIKTPRCLYTCLDTLTRNHYNKIESNNFYCLYKTRRDMKMTTKKINAQMITMTAILTAIGIVIPIIMPVKVVIGPASYTLGSHVPIMLAMFISPWSALMVTVGTTLGFLWASFPIIIVLRALSHVLFAVTGAFMLQNNSERYLAPMKGQLFSLFIAILHAIGEMAVVYVMLTTGMSHLDNQTSLWFMVFVLVGLGTIVHSMVDFVIAQWLWGALVNRLPRKLSVSVTSKPF